VTDRNKEILARTKTYTNIEIQIMTKRETYEYKKKKIQVDIKREGMIRVKRGNNKTIFFLFFFCRKCVCHSISVLGLFP